ncbi:MAG: DHA1 family multidrug resistance protein-like MFS transporter [Pseudohongiellaceae bacterium]
MSLADAPNPRLVPAAIARRNFAVLWTSNFITAIGMMGFIPLIPLFLVDLGVPEGPGQRIWSGVLTAAAPLMAAFMGPFWGSLGDRVGRKPMIMRANLAIVIFVGAMAYVRSPWELLALRLGQGVFSGYMAPAMTLVSVATPIDRQSRVVAWLQTAILFGASLGPLMGGWLSDGSGMRSVFLVSAGMSALATIMVGLWVQEKRPDSRDLTALTGPISLIKDVFADLRGLMANRGLAQVLMGVFAVRFGSSLVEPILALYIMGLQGYEAGTVGLTTGLVFSGHALATLLVTPLWGRMGDHLGYRKAFTICAGGGAMCFLGQAWVESVTGLFVLRFLSGAFLAGIVPAAFSAASRYSSESRRGGAYGLTFSSVILARALGLMAGGWLAAVIGLAPLFVISAVLMGTAMVLGRRQTDHGEPTPSSPQPAAERG